MLYLLRIQSAGEARLRCGKARKNNERKAEVSPSHGRKCAADAPEVCPAAGNCLSSGLLGLESPCEMLLRSRKSKIVLFSKIVKFTLHIQYCWWLFIPVFTVFLSLL